MSDWRSAARAGDWLAVAAGIDALPEHERSEPGTRYVRALAAHRLGDCENTLRATSGLSERLPLLRAEIEPMLRECELALGPEPADGNETRISKRARLKAARIAERNGDLDRARRILDALCVELGDGARGASKRLAARARELRASIAARLGLGEHAAADYRWLALNHPTTGADLAYERLADKPLAPRERLTRTEMLAANGRIAEVERELELVAASPRSSLSTLERTRLRARAHYTSRASYAEAARLYEEAARLSNGARPSDLFFAANAWVRSGELERAVAAYERIERLHPGSPAQERAMHRKARALYSAGRWDAAIEAYSKYLDRHGRRPREARFVRASLYERSVAELARGGSAAALAGLESLQKYRRTGYSQRRLEQLEAIALAASGVAAQENQAVERFTDIVRRHPLSFVAQVSAARLRRMGREPPRLPEPPRLAAPTPPLPPKVRLLLDLGLDTAAERALHRAEPQLRAEYEATALETLCEQYGVIDRGHRRYALAASRVGSFALGPAPTESNSWAWQCLYPRPFAAAVEGLEQRLAVPEGLLHSLMRQESAFRPDARSPVGAVGLMQLMPRTAELTARELGLEPHAEQLTRPRYNLELGAHYLSKLLATFEQRAVLALASYNAGPHAVSRWLRGSSDLALDVWAARIPYTETRRYVAAVMTNWARYRYLASGSQHVPELSLELPSNVELPSDAY